MCLSSERHCGLISGFAGNTVPMTSVVCEVQSLRCAGEGWVRKHTQIYKDCSCNSETRGGALWSSTPEANVSTSCGPSSNDPKMSSFQHPCGSAGFLEGTPRHEQVQDVQTCPFQFTEAALAQGSLAHTTLLSAFVPLTGPLLFPLSCDNTSCLGPLLSPNCKSSPFGREHKQTYL